MMIKTMLLGALFALQMQAAMVVCWSGNASCSNEAAWLAQIQAQGRQQSVIDTFTNSPLATTSITQVGGAHGSVQNDEWRDSVILNPFATPPNNPVQFTTFSYTPSAALWGFGGYFDTAPAQSSGVGGHASGITFLLDAQNIGNYRNLNNEFFGVYVTTTLERFGSVTTWTIPPCLSGGLECTGWEIFDLDNLRFAVDGKRAPEVPEPFTSGLIGAGLLVIAVRRCRAR